MPIDTSILSGLKPLQIESPLNQLGKMYELQNAQQANQLGALKMQEAQRSMGANEQLRQLYGEQGVNQDSAEFLRRLGAISPEARKAQMEFLQKQAVNQSTITRNNAQAASAGLTGQKAQLDRAKTLTDMGVSILGGATDEASYQRSLAQLKIIGGDTSQLPPRYDKTRVQEFINKGLSHKDQLAAQDRALDEKIAKEFTLNATPPLVSSDSSLPPIMQTGILTSPGAPAGMDFAGMARAKLAARPGDSQALALLQATQPKFAFQNTQNQIVPIQTNALAPGYAPPQPMAMGMSPSQAGQLGVAQGNLDVNKTNAATRQGQLGVSQGQFALAQQRLNAEMATGNFTPATIDFMAETYRQTGTLPPLGMGSKAAAARAQILTRAGELAMGGGRTAAEGASDVKGNKAENFGLTAGQRTVGTQIANVQIAANETNKMIGVAKPYVEKVDPTDYPAVNAVGNFVAKNTGDPNIVGLATALNAIVNTYARAINPKGVATVSDKNHARNILNTAMSKGQLNEAFSVMEQEMNAALASGPEVRAAMRPGAASGTDARAAALKLYGLTP